MVFAKCIMKKSMRKKKHEYRAINGLSILSLTYSRVVGYSSVPKCNDRNRITTVFWSWIFLSSVRSNKKIVFISQTFFPPISFISLYFDLKNSSSRSHCTATNLYKSNKCKALNSQIGIKLNLISGLLYPTQMNY